MLNELLKAIGRHKTPTSDGPWDGPENKANLKTDQDADYYRKAYAWQDPEGNPKTKAAYRFINHEVSADGKVGPANLRACSTGIAVLNGARGGTTIPAADKKGVWNHLAGHLRDADQEPPPLRSVVDEPERRMCEAGEIRMASSGKKIEGHFAVFNKPAQIYGFVETFKSGTFSKTIKEDDIRALRNHNDDYVLGRNKAGTLELKEDKNGLFAKIDPPDTQWASDLKVSIDRKDITGGSIGFRVTDDKWETKNGILHRNIFEARLFDVSPVTFPAFNQTDVSLRALAHAVASEAENEKQICMALLKLNSGEELSDEERNLIEAHLDSLRERLRPNDPEQDPDPDPGQARKERIRTGELHKRLDIILESL